MPLVISGEGSLLVGLACGCGLAVAGAITGVGTGAAVATGGGACRTGGTTAWVGREVTTGRQCPARDLATLISSGVIRVSSTPISCREPLRNSSTREAPPTR